MNNDLTGKLKNLKTSELVYPVISLLFLSLILGLFIVALGFLANQLNKPLAASDKSLEAEILKVDLEDYARVAKKFALTADSGQVISEPANPQKQIPAPSSSPETTSNIQSLSPAPQSTTTPSSKLDLKIAIYNASGQPGAAKVLATNLKKAGFLISETSNYPTVQEQTVIKTKAYLENYQAWITGLKLIVVNNYQLDHSEILDDSEIYDIVIIVGQK